MPTRLREEFDADAVARPVPTDYRTETNRYEVPCSGCGKNFYVDEETRRELDRALENDLDDQFICFDCEEQQDELAYR